MSQLFMDLAKRIDGDLLHADLLETHVHHQQVDQLVHIEPIPEVRNNQHHRVIL